MRRVESNEIVFIDYNLIAFLPFNLIFVVFFPWATFPLRFIRPPAAMFALLAFATAVYAIVIIDIYAIIHSVNTQYNNAQTAYESTEFSFLSLFSSSSPSWRWAPITATAQTNNIGSNTSVQWMPYEDALTIASSLSAPALGFSILNFCDYTSFCVDQGEEENEGEEEWADNNELIEQWASPELMRYHIRCRASVSLWLPSSSSWLFHSSLAVGGPAFAFACPQPQHANNTQLYQLTLTCNRICDTDSSSSSLRVLPESVNFFCFPPLFALNPIHAFLLYSPVIQSNVLAQWKDKQEALEMLNAEKRSLAAARALAHRLAGGRWARGIRRLASAVGVRLSMRQAIIGMFLLLSFIGLVFSTWQYFSLTDRIERFKTAA